MTSLTAVAPGLWCVRAPQRFFGLEVGARMTVLKLEGGVLVHSPIDVSPSVVGAIGPLRWVVAPNLLHHLYVRPWIDAGAEAWCAPGLEKKRADLDFSGIIEAESEPFGPDVLAIPLRSIPITHEVVLLHRPSRTLVATDLLFNFASDAPWPTRWVMRGLGGYPGPRTSALEKLVAKRDLAKTEIQRLLELDFDRLIVAHGEIVEAGAKRALEDAFAWL